MGLLQEKSGRGGQCEGRYEYGVMRMAGQSTELGRHQFCTLVIGMERI